MATFKTEIDQLMEQLYEDLPEIEDRLNLEPSVPGRPCSPGRLEELEEILGYELPRDYRYFLSVHNGWADISGNITFFSVNELLDEDLQGDLTEDVYDTLEDAELILCICAHTEEDRGFFLVYEDGWDVIDVEEGVVGDSSTFVEMFTQRVEEVLSYLEL